MASRKSRSATMIQLLAANAVVAQKDKRMLAAYLFMAELHQR
jgi:hypothetical protein